VPQFDQISEIWASQLFWLAIFFGAMFFIVGRGMLPRIVSTVDARNDKIADDLKVAEEVRASADALEESYRTEMDKSRSEAMKLAADAKAKAAKATEASVGKADKAIATKIDKATAKIAEARAAAMAEIETVAAEAAEAMVERVTGAKPKAGAALAAVKQELARG
jgi:F-type H+-transporting ATPase subunit b